MKKSSLTIYLLSSLLLCACADPTMVVGRPAAAVASEVVDIYYLEPPDCSFETIAYINVSGGYFSLQTMFDNMRQEAAQVGADGLYILQTQQLQTREFLGAAKAIRCRPA